MQIKNKNWLIVWAMTLGIFLSMLDTTVMNITLPAIEQGLHVSLDDLSWALNIYTISFACLTIPLGQLADRFGRNRFYVLGLCLFVLGSMISGFASSIIFLVAGRAVQSVGAAIIFPGSMTIGLGVTQLEQRSRAVMILGVTQGLAAALGPTIGGVVTTLLGWRWVFFLNVPLGVLAIIACLALLPMNTASAKETPRIDLSGMLLSMLALFSLTVTLVYGRQWGWSSMSVIALGALALISFLLFILIEHYAKRPMVPMALFQKRQFSGAAIAVIISQVLLVGVSVIMPTFLTHMRGVTELNAALIITPMSVMIFLMAPLSGSLLDKIGPRQLTFFGMTLLTVSYVIFSVMNPVVYWQLIVGCMILGSGFGIIAGPMMVLGAADFKGAMLTASQSVLGVLKQVGTLLAVAIFVSALTSNIRTAKVDSIAHTRQYVKTLFLPSQIRTRVVNEAIANIKSGGDSGQQSKATAPKGISTKAQRRIVEEQTTIAIKKAGVDRVPVSVKRKMRTKVQIAVHRRVQKDNRILIRAIRQIRKDTRRRIIDIFFKPYVYALPAAIAAISVTFAFKRKRSGEAE